MTKPFSIKELLDRVNKTILRKKKISIIITIKGIGYRIDEE